MAAIAWARFTVTDDLPTPPLPLATAITRVSEPGWANGISLAGLPPRSVSCSPERCSSVITPRVEVHARHALDPFDGRGHVAGDLVLERAAGHGQQHPSRRPRRRCRRSRRRPCRCSVIGRLISGSWTVASAAQISGWSCCGGAGCHARKTSRRGAVRPRLGRCRAAPRPAAAPRGRPAATRSSERRKSRVATSPTAIRSEATSRARNSMSACARALAWRSCSATTLSRNSCRFCASRISGAAYDACRLSIRVRKMNG